MARRHLGLFWQLNELAVVLLRLERLLLLPLEGASTRLRHTRDRLV